MSARAELLEVLERARAVGFLGPGPVEPHVAHATGFAVAAEDALGRAPRHFADLGTGGGIPGLVLADRWPSAHAIFVETGQRRAAWLREAIDELALTGRVEIVEERAEATGSPGPYREAFQLVTARSFGPPPVTAEIAAGIVEVGGVLVVSEPPEPQPERWPTDRLHVLGFGPAEEAQVGDAHFAVIPKRSPVPAGYPRGIGRPAKRPLW